MIRTTLCFFSLALRPWLLAATLLTAGWLPAQTYTTIKELGGRQAKLFEQAREASGMNKLEEARAKLDQLLETTPNCIDGWLMRAGVQHDLGDLAAAERDYEQALALSADYYPLGFYQLGLTELKQEKFDEAATHLQAFLNTGAGKPDTRQRAARYLENTAFAAEAMRQPVPFAPYTLGDSVNTPGAEYFPVLTVDGKSLIYTARVEGQEDFFFSARRPDGSWGKGQPIAGANTEQNEGTQTISADGKRILFTSCGREDGLGSCDLYESALVKGRWTAARNLGPTVNSGSWDSQPSLSADGRLLFFSSERAGGKGGRDLWVARKGSNGQWTRPENLGDSLNTALNEQAPFIHPDGQTLYFMSEGHPGMGKSDIFISRRQPDGQWGKPQNLGYPINTTAEEGGLFVDLAGATAYFTLNVAKHNEAVNFNIFAFELPAHLRPKPCTYVSGRVTDDRRQPLGGAIVRLFADGNAAPLMELAADESGAFLVVLPTGQNYAFEAAAPGFAFYSDRFELVEVKNIDEAYKLDIALSALKPSTTAEPAPVVLKNVLFKTGSAELLAASEAELGRLLELLARYPQLRVRINGHTDDVGNDADNQQLSEARAKAVYNWLEGKGIETDRLAYAGFGESRPLVPNDSPENRAVNRRTEFEILSAAQ